MSKTRKPIHNLRIWTRLEWPDLAKSAQIIFATNLKKWIKSVSFVM
ncbi:hypothetical protein SPACI_020300 [Sporomusa acidovorans DSM 3132]|uniref:Uncharacterized protein n=1 Tax=Sporomusa acidovorans (strain ATCC 49682 / DSM 3132 / Mol) TaxID=1123286 RepID=A0ABZ3J1P7_SPOA4|nr:hypothetical protein SPACI_51080 [Sporomusa acidovorans DSM 3132]SDE83610.1 hypothetical protein SAMN04488499_102325 [Sporomusa acidovorans]